MSRRKQARRFDGSVSLVVCSGAHVPWRIVPRPIALGAHHRPSPSRRPWPQGTVKEIHRRAEMSSIVASPSQRITLSSAETARLTGGARFDGIMAVLSAWIVAGFYIDGWSHRHVTVLETFFTIWHVPLYSGYVATACFTIAAIRQGTRKGAPWRQALPGGYGMAAVGLAIFAAGGMADMLWHELFGFEKAVETVISPSHLLIYIGVGLTVSGPLRAAWHRGDATAENAPPHVTDIWPALLSLTLLWSVFTFVTMFVHPFVGARPGLTNWTLVASFGPTALGFASSEGLSGIVVQTAMMMGLTLLAIGRWRLPFGSLTAVFTGNAALVSLLDEQFLLILPALVGGLGADLLLRWLQPSAGRRWAYRLFAVAVPLMLYAGYFICLKAREGLGWSVHMITGGLVLAGITGWLLSYLVFPPPLGARHDSGGHTADQTAL